MTGLDELLRETFEQRRRLVDRVERCSLALRGLGYQFDDRRERYRGFPQWPRLEGEVPSTDEGPPVVGTTASTGSSPLPAALTGAALRGRAEEILRVIGEPVTPAELVEILALQGFAVAGRPSHTLANALRVSLARGEVERTGRGRYRWAAA